jgi:ribosomal-protein-alanine N-acetyltransferase
MDRRHGTHVLGVQADDACLGHAWVNLGGSGRGTIGYWLLPGGRGRGLATRAVRLVTRWCFEALGLARVAILAEPSNRASVRVAERSGFRFEGVLRSNDEIGGRRVDNAVFSMLPGEMGT